MEKGPTSIPGVARGLVKDPLGSAKALALAPGAVLGTALPAAAVAYDANQYRKDGDERAFAGNLAKDTVGVLAGGLPMVSQMATYSGANRLTKALGLAPRGVE